jgi:threonine dehydrogenase-like Zn-dependent dehydrogenase
MEGLWLENGVIAYREDLASPHPLEGELLLAVRLAGICGTDFELLDGYAGFTGIPGHEFVADVVEGPPAWVGKRVVSSINIGCGHCDFCTRQQSSHCRNRTVIGIRNRNGAFAERLAVPVANVHAIPDAVEDSAAVLVEPLAAALEIVEQVPLCGDERVLIVGAGRLAQLIAQVLARLADTVTVLVRSEARRPSFEPLDVRLVAVPDGDYDMVVECTGSPEGLAVALDAVRPRGSIVMKSTFTSPSTVSLASVIVDEITMFGSRCGPFDKAIEWLAAGRLDVSHLRFERYPLANYRTAFARAREPDIYKVQFSGRDNR